MVRIRIETTEWREQIGPGRKTEANEPQTQAVQTEPKGNLDGFPNECQH